MTSGLKRYLWVDALVVGIRTGRGGAPDWRCFDKSEAIVASIAEIIAGSPRDKQKLPLVEPMLDPAADGGNLAERLRIAWTPLQAAAEQQAPEGKSPARRG